MVSRAALPLESLIRRLASLPLGEGNGPEVLKARLEVLRETVRADAFALLKGSAEEGPFFVLAETGFLSSPARIPFFLRSSLTAQSTPGAGDHQMVCGLEGPFSEGFLVTERAESVLMGCLGRGDGLAAALALRRTGKRFTQVEKNRFASVAYVLNLETRSRRKAGGENRPGDCDPATGLGFFPFLLQVLGKEISRSRRSAGKVTLGILSLGMGGGTTPIGERDVEQVAEVMKNQLRDFDTIIRYSGLELAFILPDAGVDEAFRVMKRVLEAVAAGKNRVSSAIHVGLSSYPEDASTLERLIETAEAALNLARDEGNSAISRWKG